MSMYPDSEHFDQLRRLLALKRHEQPPPSYFHNFSRQVIARLQAGEQAHDVSPLLRWFWETPWVQRLWATLESRPALAGALGVAACSLLLAGFVYSGKPEGVPDQFLSSSSEAMLASPTAHTSHTYTLGSAALPDSFGTNGFGNPSPNSLDGQQVRFILTGN